MSLCFLLPYPQLNVTLSVIQVFVERRVEEKERKQRIEWSSFKGGLELFGAGEVGVQG